MDDRPPTTPTRIAARYGMSPETVRNKIKSGEIEAFLIGTRYKIPAYEAERLAREWSPERASAAPSA